jgi:hypothetical protein
MNPETRWTYDHQTGYIGTPPHAAVARITAQVDPQDQHEVGHLVASAPRLLDALIDITAMFSSFIVDQDCDGDLRLTEEERSIEHAQEAINKARGES